VVSITQNQVPFRVGEDHVIGVGRLLAPCSTVISNALARGLTVFETARIAGTSTRMIEIHHGALLDAAHDSLLERLEGSGH
jgi:hypothetical protein